MEKSVHIPYLPETIPVSVQVIGVALVAGLLYSVYSIVYSNQPWKGIPIISLEEKGLSPKDSWIRDGPGVLKKGYATTDGPFQVMTGTGPKIVLPNKFAEEMKARPDASMTQTIVKDFFSTYPGFEAFHHSLADEGFIPEVVRTKLTQSLGIITNDLVDETTAAVHDFLGEDKEWHSLLLKQNVAHIVARLSSRVFLGMPLCRNKRWLEIAEDYTVHAMMASRRLKAVPALSRPFLHRFLPECKMLRKDCRDAKDLILPEVERRKARAQKALAAGEKPPKTADTIGWMYEIARERAEQKDYVSAQLSLTLAAIHTTSEAITQAMLDLCERSDIIQPLREEVIKVIGEEGWSKQSLYKLRLMDSFLKESQRFHPPNATSMMRMCTSPITLSDGTVLPKGARTVIAGSYNDESIYKEPQKFDPYRFVRHRDQPDQNTTWQHVTVAPAHFAFGYGQHACPGRFFASNEIKILLAHLLLKYEWKAMGDGKPTMWGFETMTMARQDCQVQLRRRKEEVELDLKEPLV